MKYLILLLFFIGSSVIATEPQGDHLQANTSENTAVNEVLEIKIDGTKLIGAFFQKRLAEM